MSDITLGDTEARNLVAEAIRRPGESLWDEADGFFYDALHMPDGRPVHMRLRSMVGLIPLFAVETIEVATLLKLPGFAKRCSKLVAHS